MLHTHNFSYTEHFINVGGENPVNLVEEVPSKTALEFQLSNWPSQSTTKLMMTCESTYYQIGLLSWSVAAYMIWFVQLTFQNSLLDHSG